MDQVFTYWSPLSPATVFRGIRTLPPGQWLLLKSNGESLVERYWELTFPEAGAEPYYQRRFDPEETRSVRLYLHGGDDRIESEGPAGGKITGQALGGPGDDTLDDSRSGGTRFDDSEGANEVRKGPGTKVDERPWTNPRPDRNAPWFEPRDYNRVWLGNALLWWEPLLTKTRQPCC